MKNLSIYCLTNLKIKFPENIIFFPSLTISVISLAIRKAKIQSLDNLINCIIVLAQ